MASEVIQGGNPMIFNALLMAAPGHTPGTSAARNTLVCPVAA
jgi:hypothetical protein